MRRTTSGSDLSASELYATSTATPYVYISRHSASSPLTPAAHEDTFRRHCGGATVRLLHGSHSTRAFPFPSGFEVVVADGFVTAQTGFAREPIFSLPLRSIARAQLLDTGGVNAGLWSLLCRCCFGSRQKLLALDVDAPVGWIQWEALHGEGLAGPLRLGLHVLDVDEWLDAMELTLD